MFFLTSYCDRLSWRSWAANSIQLMRMPMEGKTMTLDGPSDCWPNRIHFTSNSGWPMQSAESNSPRTLPRSDPGAPKAPFGANCPRASLQCAFPQQSADWAQKLPSIGSANSTINLELPRVGVDEKIMGALPGSFVGELQRWPHVG